MSSHGYDGDGDTIAAIATPPGVGGIGIVRLSGPQAVAIVEALFRSPHGRSLRLRDVPSHTLHYGHIVRDGVVLDEVLVAVMRAPRSYTREDVVEIHAHGGPVPLRAILEAVWQAGARPAQPGEFTRRAFTNGRLSLDQAQAVLDVIQAKTRLSLQCALDRLQGRFSQPLRRLKDRLTELLAGVHVGLDFPEYEEDALSREALVAGLKEACREIGALLERGLDGRVLREGFVIAIVGRPNVGKSTLLNALLQQNRAIVTPVPGTTRDTLEELVEIRGIPFRLVDTAGLRRVSDSDGDEVEQLGIERTRSALSAADLVLFLVDLSAPLRPEDRQIAEEVRQKRKRHLLLLNKADLPHALDPREAAAALGMDHEAEEALILSARTGEGLEALKDRLVEWVWGGRLPRHEDVFWLDARERDLLRRAQEVLNQAQGEAQSGAPLDLLAVMLQEALEVLGELTGESASEAVIDRIFSKFCVGK